MLPCCHFWDHIAPANDQVLEAWQRQCPTIGRSLQLQQRGCASLTPCFQIAINFRKYSTKHCRGEIKNNNKKKQANKKHGACGCAAHQLSCWKLSGFSCNSGHACIPWEWNTLLMLESTQSSSCKTTLCISAWTWSRQEADSFKVALGFEILRFSSIGVYNQRNTWQFSYSSIYLSPSNKCLIF